ncbi:hypothetical protein PanWU01x14_266550 [Parasponia andersonii]|uniref:Uncharacterized protein n=1 Tax=Parasponia andersonii TaxID=3476 RepID=A0A2P5B6R4_PARAD|nr:hypothetical protein PanWU01x14_266550 [Parasponia andersonii]
MDYAVSPKVFIGSIPSLTINQNKRALNMYEVKDVMMNHKRVQTKSLDEPVRRTEVTRITKMRILKYLDRNRKASRKK